MVKKWANKLDFYLNDTEINSCIYMEKNASLNLLIKLYEFFTKKKLKWEAPSQKIQLDYQFQNYTALMKFNKFAQSRQPYD